MECEPFSSYYALRGQFNEADGGHGVRSLPSLYPGPSPGLHEHCCPDYWTLLKISRALILDFLL